MEVDVGPFSALENGRGHCAEAGSRSLAIFRLGDRVYALENACPHRGGPLCEGDVDPVAEAVFCPLHAWGFDLRSGEGTNVKRTRAAVYPARVSADRVLVTLPAGQPSSEGPPSDDGAW